MAIHQPPLLRLARHHRQGTRQGKCAAADALEKDYGVDRYIVLGLWGMESSFGDVIVNPKYMRPVIPALAALAWGERAPARLLGSRTAQRAHHRRSRLGKARRDDRLLGRRHGPHPMDAGSVAAHGRRLQPRRPDDAVRRSRRFARRHRALSGRARRLPARRGLGLRGQGRRPRGRRLAHLCGMAKARRPPRGRRALCATERPREAVGAGRAAGRCS